ncbi:MAG: serine protease Do [Patescibacteria group bacterium]|nr:serine protease Do [Patescibacteria group bacterium]
MDLNKKISKTKKKQIFFSMGYGILIFVLASLTITGFVLVKKELEYIKSENTKLEISLIETQNIVQALVLGKDELAVALEAEKDQREKVQAEYENSVEQLATLEASVEGYQQKLESRDIVKIINDWSPRVARLQCEFINGLGQTITSKASGVATFVATGTRFITNKHVISKDFGVSKKCNISFATGNTKLEATLISVIEEKDLAYVDMNKYVNLPGVVGAVKTCVDKPVIGDQVVILGYPSVGAEEGITATEGIVSGIDDDYYVTSAKIEQGNSGGAAILVKNNCLLGLPTLVVAGKIESLARILPIK